MEEISDLGHQKLEKAGFYLREFGFPTPVTLDVAGEGRIAFNCIVGLGGPERYILRSYDLEQGRELGYGKERFDFEATVLKFIEGRASVATPALLYPVQGGEQPYLESGGAIVLLYQMLEGVCLEQSQLSKDTALQAADCLRTLAEAFAEFEPGNNVPSGSLGYIVEITGNLRSRAPQMFEDVRLSEMHDYIVQFPWSADLEASPQGIVHGDFFFENTLWNDEGALVGVIDFGDCFYGPLLHDIAVGAMEFSMCEGERFDDDAFNAFLNKFSSWFAENKINFDLFKAVLLANCVRYSTHLIALGLDDGVPHADLLTAEFNPYVGRFQRFSGAESLASSRKYFPT